MITIIDRLYQDYKFAQRQGYEVAGVFLYGSQNYNLDTENSDIDTKLIIVPSLQDLIEHKSWSDVHDVENGTLTIYDIVSFVNNLKKMNVNFLECLFTEHFLLDPTYAVFLTDLMNHGEEIAKYNPILAMQSMKGIGVSAWKHLELECDKEDTGDAKKASRIFQLLDMAKKYARGLKYVDCLKSSSEVKRVKQQEKVNLQEVEKYKKELVEVVDKFISEHADFVSGLQQNEIEHLKERIKCLEEEMIKLNKTVNNIIRVVGVIYILQLVAFVITLILR